MTTMGKFVLFIVLATLLVLLAMMQSEAGRKTAPNNKSTAWPLGQ